MQQLDVHEIATLFPTMSEVDMDDLKASIEKEGQLEEILVFEDQILDGRHRYEACLALGIEPRLRVFEGTAQEAFAYSVALNLSRRHLTTVQRAAAGAGIKEFQARLMAGDEPEPVEAAEEEVDVAETSDLAEADQAEDVAEEAPAPKPKRKGPSPRTINAKARAIASQRVGVSGRTIDVAAKIKAEAPDVFQRMLEGKAGSIPDAKKVMALSLEEREKVHALVDEGAKIKDALKQVVPPPPPEAGPVFLGKVVLEPAQAEAFEAILEERGIKRAEAAREALVDWIGKHGGVSAPADGQLVAV
jgi:ParB-like chromosome segregation protein Spo0J